MHTIRCDPIGGFNHPISSGLIRGLWKLQSRNATLLEDLQIVVKPTLLRDLDHCYNG